MTNMQDTEFKSHSVLMHICHRLWSMTNVHLLCLNHTQFQCTFVIDCGQWQKCFDTFYDLHPLKSGQWQICRIVSLNHTQFQCTFVIDCGQWQICMHICHWLRSMTIMRAYLSLTDGQWQKCAHICHWLVSLTGFILYKGSTSKPPSG